MTRCSERSPAAERDDRDAHWYRRWISSRARPDYERDATDLQVLVVAHELRQEGQWTQDALTNAALLWERLGATGSHDTKLGLRVLRYCGLDVGGVLEGMRDE